MPGGIGLHAPAVTLMTEQASDFRLKGVGIETRERLQMTTTFGVETLLQHKAFNRCRRCLPTQQMRGRGLRPQEQERQQPEEAFHWIILSTVVAAGTPLPPETSGCG